MRFYIFILGLLIPALSFGQMKTENVEVNWGRMIKAPKRSTLLDIVGNDDSGIYTIRVSYGLTVLFGSKYVIEHYDKKMNQSRSVELDLKYNDRNRDYEFILHSNNKLYLFTSFKNQQDKKNYLFVQTINKKTLLLNSDVKKIAEIDYANNSRYNAGNYNYRFSRNESKILIYYNLPWEKKENERFGFHVFDPEMNQIWENSITLPYEEKLFSIEGYEVDESGNVHVLGIVYKEKLRTHRKGEPNYKYHILSYLNGGKEMREYTASLGDKFITDMQIAINGDKDIICAGFYSHKGTVSISGSYFLKIDSDSREIVTKSFKEFGLDFITQNLTRRQEKKVIKRAGKGKNVELFEFDLDEIILRDDGGAVLIGEQFYVRTVTTRSANGGTSTTNYYYYNDIIAVNISPKGEIEWAEKVAKRQVTTNDGGFFSSYYVAVNKDKISFVFNDNMRNITHPNESRPAPFVGGKRAVVVLVEINSKGEETKKPLFVTKEMGTIIRPKVAEQISPNEVILFGQLRKKQRFAKVTFK